MQVLQREGGAEKKLLFPDPLNVSTPAPEDLPLRAELFNIEQLERHAKSLAKMHQLTAKSPPDTLLPRLTQNERFLIETYDAVTAAAALDRRIEPAGEWLLDNFYLIEEQILAIRRLLPPSYSRELPRLANTDAVNCPRVYGIALEFIAHVDGRADATSLNSFIAAYQTVTPLKLGELWAIPLMFRLGLIENLRRVSVRIAAARRDRDLASGWAEQMLAVIEHRPTDVIIVLADLARSQPVLSGAFLSELTRHMHGQNPNFSIVNHWLDQRLGDEGLKTEDLVRKEGQAQAADQVSVGNCISSLRLLAANDWREFVAEQSVVEQILMTDPADVYRNMDFATRDRYRHAVEAIARRSRRDESEVAQQAIRLAEEHFQSRPAQREAHVGYYLIDRGRPILERSVKMKFTAAVLLDKMRRAVPLSCYLLVFAFTTLLTEFLFFLLLQVSGGLNPLTLGWLPLIGVSITALICASQLGVGVVNWLVIQFIPPRSLPRLDFEAGIPQAQRTLVAVPTMLTNKEGIEHLLEGLELRYLSNRDKHLHFALLTDFTDAAEESTLVDADLLQQAQSGIRSLNKKYAETRGDIFSLFHRSRSWNQQEGVWMGRERKRGKLCDLNAYLRGNRSGFSVIEGETEILMEVQYVITLDTDTQLPRDAARQMIGTLAHLLNRPKFDAKNSRVTDGYVILQPRVEATLLSGQRSLFSRLFSGSVGIDPYTRVVSDVYQDLFAEGSFIGKGIYDVDAFQRCCNLFPENKILSHDLIEGAYSRSALLSDVTLYEEFPARYATDSERRHRWIRGDWQIAPWLLPLVSGPEQTRIRNPISMLSRWKILDNLRRSIVPIAMLLLLIVSWCLSPAVALGSSLLILSIIFLPILLTTVSDLLRKPVDLPGMMHVQATLKSAVGPLLQNLLTLVFLPYEACLCLDAIARTLWRMLWSKRKLLEWKTASDAERPTRGKLMGLYRTMLIGPLVGLEIMMCLWYFHPTTIPYAAPWLAVWAISPLICWWLNRTISVPQARLTTDQRLFLRKLSRKTWRYFEEFVTEQENWLPPDNIQFNDNLVVAARTSPTNIGMSLLADLAAYDFGYCAASQVLLRLQRTLGTMSRMERYRGHFYNWYDTRTLEVMRPSYVSAVDSGNLAGNLLVLRQGCIELAHGPILPEQICEGLADTLQELIDVARGEEHIERDLLRKLERQRELLKSTPATLSAVYATLKDLNVLANQIRLNAPDNSEFAWWAAALKRSSEAHRRDLEYLASWITLSPPPETSETIAEQCREHWQQLETIRAALDTRVTLPKLAQTPLEVVPLVAAMIPNVSVQLRSWLEAFRDSLVVSAQHAATRLQEFEQTAVLCGEFAEMDFGMLYDKKRDLFSIGCNIAEQRLDASYYDMLASEARLASYIVIAQGDIGQEHWFALGRLLTRTGRDPALLSWSGSMFEYLMPLLVMPNYANTFLDRTYRAIVRRQIEHARRRGVPWGISESGYSTIDQHRTYQYRAFGVPGLGLKRGLNDDLVIAPYASALALMVSPEAACKNLKQLDEQGQQGHYGMYEAIDYTPSRMPPGMTSVTVRQFMVHHLGMSLLSYAYVLLNQPMQRRFLSDPMLQSATLLLQERVPKPTPPVFPHASEVNAARTDSQDQTDSMRIITNPNRPTIDTHLLSNDRYHVVVTSSGGGYSRWEDLAVTRWREDATRDCYGSFCYVRDLNSGEFWSNSWQPTTAPATSYEAIFTQSRAEFRRVDQQIETYTQISVSPEDDIELRRVTLTNRSDKPRQLEVTSFSEIVLATQAQDEAHPAFSNLFVQTELVPEYQAIYCTRRPRSAEERPPWLTHMMTVRGQVVKDVSYETDRMKFVGRQRTLESPLAMTQKTPLSNTAGPVLDPVASIRQTVLLQPNQAVEIDIVTGVSDSRSEIETLTQKYSDSTLTSRIFDLSWTHSQILLQQLNISEADAQIFGRLAGSIIYGSALHRAKASVLMRNRQGQSGLWGYGISGDLPIVLVRIRDHNNVDLVRQVVQAHAYWRSKGLQVDLVIWNEDDSVYRQTLQDEISDLVAAGPEGSIIDRPGGVFIRRGEQMADEDRTLLQTVARLVFLDDGRSLADQAERRLPKEVAIQRLNGLPEVVVEAETPEIPYYDLKFFNGLGGFSHDGREYVIILAPGKTTPAPWVNVLANEQFGTVVSEGGSAYTWAENSHEYRLTPWHNDPVSDTTGEALYLRDEETGRFWSPTPLPARGKNTYVTRHGFGYSIFDYTEEGVTSELSVYVAIDASVKFYKLKVTNHSGRSRQLSLTGYWEFVLGDTRRKSLLHIVTETDPNSGAILARNVYNPEFGDRVAFVNCSESSTTLTGDRTEFVGRNGHLNRPAAMHRVRLSGRVGAGLDPCAAFQAPFVLGDGEEKTLTFTMGAASNLAEAKSLAQQFRSVENAQRAIEAVWDFWSRALGVIHLESPDPSVNFLVNGWLVYQTLACRMWARSGFYQSGGAFGFRDQLQDAMAMVHVKPDLLRKQLLLAASRQFREGDVQHWWHPPQGRGVRTKFSDDLLWLPLGISRYVGITADSGILDEKIPFLSARLLHEDEESNYDLPHTSDEVGTLYEHGIRAIDHALKFGEHGLPLMGCGDWNDGMNLVGMQGSGESVWLAFFLYQVLEQFAELARARNDTALADRYSVEAGRLRGNIEQNAWDGEWYRRAYFDDGTPLGSHTNDECQIDAISQSWSILSGAGSVAHKKEAMASLYRRLVRTDDRLILLLDPPFDKSDLDPGYIKGYVPGVRENGGQYTHSAIWTVMAFAVMGENERTWELFSLINPISHGDTPESIATYRVEPYVVAADVYGIAPHTSRGGWTWYTGSSGWMYRLIVESIVGLQVEDDRLSFHPCVPPHWDEFKMHYRYRETFYHISVTNAASSPEVQRIIVDDVESLDSFVTLIDDHQDHRVVIEMG